MRACAVLLILSAAGVATSAQSLADVARQESERRQAITNTGKTYTDKDLKPVRELPAPEASAAPVVPAKSGDDNQVVSDAAKGVKTTGKTSDAKAEVKDQAYWSKRMAALREQLDRDQVLMAALQSRINALTTDFVNRDDPAQRSQISNERQKALAELDRLKAAVEQDQRAIPELEEEARTSGVPAGWLR